LPVVRELDTPRRAPRRSAAPAGDAAIPTSDTAPRHAISVAPVNRRLPAGRHSAALSRGPQGQADPQAPWITSWAHRRRPNHARARLSVSPGAPLRSTADSSSATSRSSWLAPPRCHDRRVFTYALRWPAGQALITGPARRGRDYLHVSPPGRSGPCHSTRRWQRALARRATRNYSDPDSRVRTMQRVGLPDKARSRTFNF
jgi:hypothetical protein